MQEEVTKKIADRAKEIFDWQKDLEKVIEELTVENKKLLLEKKRLENSMNEAQLCLITAQESLDVRDQRISSDIVHDKVQGELHRVSIFSILFFLQIEQKLLFEYNCSYDFSFSHLKIFNSVFIVVFFISFFCAFYFDMHIT